VTAGSATVPLRGVIVDLLGRRYDGVAAVERVALAGLPVIAVAEHDDLATRKRALAAGAGRVFSYNKFSTDGARLVAAWLSADGGEP
jgi:DNA-binding NarL/FixJ family response regulator